MNGPDRYRKAAGLLHAAEREDAASIHVPLALAAAQVHATLALVALLVDTHSSRIQPRELIAEWAEATR